MMMAMVHFRTERGAFAVPVSQSHEVVGGADIQPLPSAEGDGIGLLRRRDEMLTVVAPLGGDGRHILVLEGPSGRFALLVQQVMGIIRIDDHNLGPVPSGQSTAAIRGTTRVDDEVIFILDVEALAPAVPS